MPLLLGAWRLQGLRGLGVPLGSLQVEDVGQTASASWGLGQIQREMLQETVLGVFFLCFGLVLHLGWQQLSCAARLVTI